MEGEMTCTAKKVLVTGKRLLTTSAGREKMKREGTVQSGDKRLAKKELRTVQLRERKGLTTITRGMFHRGE